MTRRAFNKATLLKDFISKLSVSPTLEINEITRQLRQANKPVYAFGFGQSPFPIEKSLRQKLVENVGQKDYLPVRGLPELQNAIATHQNKLLASNLKKPIAENHFLPQNILIGPGSKIQMFDFLMSFNGGEPISLYNQWLLIAANQHQPSRSAFACAILGVLSSSSQHSKTSNKTPHDFREQSLVSDN